MRTIQLVVIVLLDCKNLLVDCIDRRDFLRSKYFLVMFDNLLQFSGMQPFALAAAADFNLDAVVRDRGKG